MMKKKLLIYLVTLLGFISVNSQVVGDYNLLIVDGIFATEAKSELETLGHSVTIDQASNLINGYDYSGYNAIIFMYDSPLPSGMPEILTLNTNNQLGIILFRATNIISSVDMGTAEFYSYNDFTIDDNTHYITQVFPTGTLDLGFDIRSDLTAVNPGNTILGSVTASNGSLVVNDNYRRVFCPYYGHPAGMPWTADAATLMDRIIAWAVDNSTLDVEDEQLKKKIKCVPNPSSQFIQVTGLETPENYKILNALGAEINTGEILNMQKINIQNLANGIYFLKFNNGDTVRFVKK